jgi:hypothetical protein
VARGWGPESQHRRKLTRGTLGAPSDGTSRGQSVAVLLRRRQVAGAHLVELSWQCRTDQALGRKLAIGGDYWAGLAAEGEALPDLVSAP